MTRRSKRLPPEPLQQWWHRPLVGKWTAFSFFQLYLYLGACLLFVFIVPNTLFNPETRTVTLLLGAIGIWRYGWWLTNFVRSVIYGTVKYPKLRDKAEALWLSGWRPKVLHVVMTTYAENPQTTNFVIDSICRELHRHGLKAKLWLCYGFSSDADTVQRRLGSRWSHVDIETTLIQQGGSGKRIALGLLTRAMSRYGLHDDDLVIFMDGDSIIGEDTFAKCIPLFGIRPDLQAVTTDEDAVVYGPKWVQMFLDLRFTQRRLTMQSCALSERVLTLTGRMSMFRAKHLKSREFVETMENDYLEHWLWGRFRFLSGDDKSTWYDLVQKDSPMIYVPDAMVYTTERIEGNGWDRMVSNYRRWSGNMLRTGARAIALGPRRMPLFIWWTLVDQRINMWTALIAPISAISMTLTISPLYLFNFFIWEALARLLICMMLFRYAPYIDLRWPFILYGSQITNAVMKIHNIFRLAQQRWANRGNQQVGGGSGALMLFRRTMAMYLTAFWVTLVVLLLAVSHGALIMPGVAAWRSFFSLP
jgi:glycosyltransferase Alg8